jgi:hypothetical protein
MSGMASGAIGTEWYSLRLGSGVIVSPLGGDYSTIRAEGEVFTKRLTPLRSEVEAIILSAIELGAPVVRRAGEADGYIDGVIDEDEAELSASRELDDERRRMVHEQRRREEPMKRAHFESAFRPGMLIDIAITGIVPEHLNTYELVLRVNERVRRSTLNRIQERLIPLLQAILEDPE